MLFGFLFVCFAFDSLFGKKCDILVFITKHFLAEVLFSSPKTIRQEGKYLGSLALSRSREKGDVFCHAQEDLHTLRTKAGAVRVALLSTV